MGNPITHRIRYLIELLNIFESSINDTVLEQHSNEEFNLRSREIFRYINVLEDNIDKFIECVNIDDYSFSDGEKIELGRTALTSFWYANTFSS